MDVINQLANLEQESIQRGIPILGREKGHWLLQKIKEVKPAKILELGTANGYSGIILGSEGADLTTVEIDPRFAQEARENFQKFDIKARVLVADGVSIIAEIAAKHKELYDVIFIDFFKKGYVQVLPACLMLLKLGGYIIADNITMDKCQDFKEAVLTHPQLQTEIINIKDGLSCSKKIH